MREVYFFFFNDTATTEIYTLSLHDALPIWKRPPRRRASPRSSGRKAPGCSGRGCPIRPRCTGRWSSGSGITRARTDPEDQDRKSTRLNSSHSQISYAVFCLKKKKQTRAPYNPTEVRTQSLVQQDALLYELLSHACPVRLLEPRRYFARAWTYRTSSPYRLAK